MHRGLTFPLPSLTGLQRLPDGGEDPGSGECLLQCFSECEVVDQGGKKKSLAGFCSYIMCFQR